MTRLIHSWRQSSSPTKKEASKCVLPEVRKMKTRPTHTQKQDKPQSVSPEVYTLETRWTHQLKKNQVSLCHQKCTHWKPGQLADWNKTGRIVTRRVHMKTRPTHFLKQDRPQSVSPEKCTLKARPTHILKQNRSQSVLPEKCTLNTRQTYTLKQNRPQSVSPEECTLKIRPTHPLNKTSHIVTRRVHIESQANSHPETK